MEPLGMRRMGEHDYAAKDPMLLTEAEAYERYAPDTAFVVEITDTSTAAEFDVYTYKIRSETDEADRWIDWGDGTKTFMDIGEEGYGKQISHTHTYAMPGRFVVMISDSITGFGIGALEKVVLAMRYGDHIKVINSGRTVYSYHYTSGFRACYLKNKWLPRWPSGLEKADYAYAKNTGLTGAIPAWPTTLTSARFTFNGCTGLTGAWTDDPAELMPTNITSHDGCVSGASDALRALFYSDWGGTKEETTTT